MTDTHRISLTARQQEILVWLTEYIRRHGYSPTIRELCLAFQFASPQGAMCHLESLRKKGWVTWQEKLCRTIRPIGSDCEDGERNGAIGEG